MLAAADTRPFPVSELWTGTVYMSRTVISKMEDAFIEIDPEMYIICRLCIEEKGKYQIVPILQEKTKSAFDIEIKLFDGFSQVMCDKCKNIVTEICEMKEKFQRKQQKMRMKLLKKSDPAQEEAMSSRSGENHDLEIKERKRQKKSRTNVSIFSSSEDEIIRSQSPTASIASDKSYTLIEDEAIITEEKTSKSINTENEQHCDTLAEEFQLTDGSWKSLYNLTYICRYCNKHIHYKHAIRDHVRLHDILLRSRKKLIRSHSFVKLSRFDTNLNLTASNDVVVINPRTIISDSLNPDYYILYTPTEDSNTKRNKDFKKLFTCEDVVSDDDDDIYDDDDDDDTDRPKLRKRTRSKSNLPEGTRESGDSSIDISSVIRNETTNYKLGYKKIEGIKAKRIKREHPKPYFDVIQKIISTSVENARKNRNTVYKTKNIVKTHEGMDSINRVHDSLLKIDHKVIVTSCYSSLGLLTFLKQKNLKIQWVNLKNTCNLSKSKSSRKDSPNVMIQTKWYGNEKYNKLEGFQSCVKMLHGKSVNNSHSILQQSGQKDIAASSADKMTTTDTTISVTSPVDSMLTAPPSCTKLRNSPILSDSKPIILKSNLVKVTDPKLLTLLNANRVLNPKQASKKKIEILEILNNHELQSVNMENKITLKKPDYLDLTCTISDTEDDVSSGPSCERTDKIVPFLNNSSSGMCIPIINATESLAQIGPPESSERSQESSPENKNLWINCQSFSELGFGKEQNEGTILEAINNDNRAKVSIADPVNVMNAMSPLITDSFPTGNVIMHTDTLPNKPLTIL